MKAMGSGTGFFLCLGSGLGIGLFGGAGWGWEVAAIAMLIAIANVLLKSDHYKDYVENCEGKEIRLESSFLQKFIIKGNKTKPSIPLYISLSFVQNALIILVVSFIVFFVRGLMHR